MTFPSPGEFGEYRWRGAEVCFGTTLTVQGRTVFVDIARDKLEPERVAAARSLVASQDELGRAFDAFKEEQAAQHPDAAEEIHALQLDMLAFYADSDPSLVEVTFTLESGDDAWFCALRDLTFFDLADEQ